jgi:predicted phosphoribosyltransferase
MAVGQYYYNFAQVSDAEVIELLKEIQQFPRPA